MHRFRQTKTHQQFWNRFPEAWLRHTGQRSVELKRLPRGVEFVRMENFGLISDQAARRPILCRLPENEDGALVGLEKAEQGVNRRRLSRAVRPDEGNNRFALDGDVEIANRVNFTAHEAGAIGFREAFDLNRRCTHCRVCMLAPKSAPNGPSIEFSTRCVPFGSRITVDGRLRIPNCLAIVCPWSRRTGKGSSFANGKFAIS